MAKKTFIPSLVFLLRKACVYIARYRTTLLIYLPEGGEAALNGVLAACEIFIDLTDHEIAP